MNRDGLFPPRQPGEGKIPRFRISPSRTDLHHSSLKGIPVAVLILALLAVALGAVVRVAAPAVLKTDSGAAKLVSCSSGKYPLIFVWMCTSLRIQ